MVGLSNAWSLPQLVKFSALSRGLAVSKTAADRLSVGGTVPLTLHEYATTGGVTIRMPDDVYLNAPFDEWWCTDPEAELTFDEAENSFVVEFRGRSIPATAIPLPGYLGRRDGSGRLVTDVAMSHGDRVRLSPIVGCTLDCKFCDLAGLRYIKRQADQLLQAFDVASADDVLPVHHVLISGGTPNTRDFEYYDSVCKSVIAHSEIAVDVMMVARPDASWIDRLVGAGLFGLAINTEVYGDDAAQEFTRLKSRIGRRVLAANIERAVQATAGGGRARSLIVAGLEPLDVTLEGVKFIASLGCDPVLSPFRPARGTGLANAQPPSVEYLETLYLESVDICDKYSVKLGPRCIPCQHNTLVFPDSSGDYYYSGASGEPTS